MMDEKQKRGFIKKLQAILPAESILTQQEALRPFECDALFMYRRVPWITLLPQSIEEIVAIMRLCHDDNVPVVARGAATGLSAGALPHEEGVLLALSKFTNILSIDEKARTAWVQCGVRNLAISEAAHPYGLYYAPDPSSQLACTIGGNIAGNSGGAHCLKYGLTVHNVMAVKMVTHDGNIVTLGSEAIEQAGYDLMAVIIGSEGMLGIVVEIMVKLLPLPECTKTMLIGFSSIVDAANAVSAIIGAGIIPASLELMDRITIDAVEKTLKIGYPKNCEAILICELDGETIEVEEEINMVKNLMQTMQAHSIQIAKDEEERARYWKGRKQAFPALGEYKPDNFCMDGTVPRGRLPEVLQGIQSLSDEYKLMVANVFHAGDGNLHPLILYDADKAGELDKAKQLGAKILELCIEAGGTITGEHGVGYEKIDQMAVQFTQAELTQFYDLKRVFDPDYRLNPEKLIPNPKHCAE